MGLLQQWRDTAYSQQTDKKVLQKFWTDYFMIEKGIYEKLLSEPDVKVKGTVKELAAKYESLIVPNPIEEMDEDTEVNLIFDKEKLYKNMVDAKADWLYGLPMWDNIFDEDKKKALYREAKKANTVIKGKKVGRNDPCPCGSGKKYKFCCGKNA